MCLNECETRARSSPESHDLRSLFPFLKSGVSVDVKHPFSCHVKHTFLKSGVSVDVKHPFLKSGVSLDVKHPFLKSGNSKVTKSGECTSHCFK